MHKISVINKKERIDIIINKVKILSGTNYDKKDMVIKVISNYFNRVFDSDFSKEIGSTSVLLYHDNNLRISDFDFYYVSKTYDPDLDCKLGTKSLALAYVNSLIENIEYKEEFQMINSLLQTILEELEFDIDLEFKTFFELELNKKIFVKLLSLYFVNDDSIVNNYDFSLKDRIKIQLKMLKKITKCIKKNVIILIDIPEIDCELMDMVNDINGYVLIVCDSIKIGDDYDYIFLDNDIVIDIADDNCIFEICNNYNSHLTINEMKKKIISNHLTKK